MVETARLCLRILVFRASREEFLNLRSHHLVFGLVATWLAGIGRYWDHPRAERLQYFGVGSIIYVFLLAAILFLIFRPLFIELTYFRFLTFITLTSPPALLYAIPVERFTSISVAQSINMWFLLIVASWRVALLFRFLRLTAAVPWWKVVILGLLPLCAIVMTLTVLNLEHVVFDIMAGIERDSRGPNDTAYMVTFVLGVLSMSVGPVLLIFWIALLAQKALAERLERKARVS